MQKRQLFCVKCDELRDTINKKILVTHTIKGEGIVVESLIPHCKECGIQLSDLDVEENHFNEALNEYRRRKNLLLPEQIKNTREKYGLSQRAFSRALGFSEITINRYEGGAIQDLTHNGIILLVDEPQNMLIIARQNKDNLSNKELEAIENNVKKLLDTSKIANQSVNHELINKLNKMDKKLSKIDDLDKKVNLLLHHIKHHIDNLGTKPYEFKLDQYQKPTPYAKDFEELIYIKN